MEPTSRSSGPKVVMEQAEDVTKAAALRHLTEIHGPVLDSFLTRLTDGDARRTEQIRLRTLRRALLDPAARTADGRWSRFWILTTAKRIFAEEENVGEPNSAGLSDARTLRDALDSLPERLRIPLVEIYFQERSIAEVAALLLVPAGTVEARLAGAFRVLRQVLP